PETRTSANRTRNCIGGKKLGSENASDSQINNYRSWLWYLLWCDMSQSSAIFKVATGAAILDSCAESSVVVTFLWDVFKSLCFLSLYILRAAITDLW
ncbi:hypothetical protein BC938DRAFT_477467, partial [Jimgerdemannia flammicorona]